MPPRRHGANRRLGRPPASDPAATRERILLAARATFSELGYSATTNQHVASSAGVTTGAIYHYFESKLELYREVHIDVEKQAYSAGNAVIARADSFLSAFRTVLDLAHDMNNDDPSIGRFMGTARIDVLRSPELRTVVETTESSFERLIKEMVDLGVGTGEIDVVDIPKVTALLQSVLLGLVYAVSDDRGKHRAAIDGFQMVFEGSLFHKTPLSSQSRPGTDPT